MDKAVVVLGTFDTKGVEFKFIKDIIEGEGVKTIAVNAGVKGKPFFEPDISNEEVAKAGGVPLNTLVERNDRGQAIDVMMKGAAAVVGNLFQEGKVAGIISLGGSAGTTIGSHVMQTLPVGMPKVMVSTVASGDTRPYVGVKDVTMMYSVIDISGINVLSSQILANAANAIAGMAKGNVPQIEGGKTLLAATMFGVTTPCVSTARKYLEDHGYEVLVFHATGTGGKAMESLIEGGFVKGVMDVTTTEWCDELVGGVFGAGPERLDAAAKMGIPQVVSTGALDMVNFGALDTVPAQFKDRNLYKHNATVTLMRTTVEECAELGRIIAGKLNKAQKNAALFIPRKGVSLIDVEGQPFYGPEEDKALFKALKENITNPAVQIVEMDTDINDDAFALAMAKKLTEMMEE